MTDDSSVARGRALVRSAFAVLLAPTAVALGLAIHARSVGLPVVLLSAALVAFILVVCYRRNVSTARIP